jgi:hypothetical protein
MYTSQSSIIRNDTLELGDSSSDKKEGEED